MTSPPLSACEKCAKPIATENIIYSTTGEVVCQSCIDAAQRAEVEARGEAAMRKARAIFTVLGVLLLLVGIASIVGGIVAFGELPVDVNIPEDAMQRLRTDAWRPILVGLGGGAAGITTLLLRNSTNLWKRLMRIE